MNNKKSVPKEFKIKQIISLARDIVLVCDDIVICLDCKDFLFPVRFQSGQKIQIYGETIPIQVWLDGRLIIHNTHKKVEKEADDLIKKAAFDKALSAYWNEKEEIEFKIKLLPFLYQKRIEFLRFCIEDFDILFGKQEVEACYAATLIINDKSSLQQLKPEKIANLNQVYEKQLALAYDQSAPKDWKSSKVLKINKYLLPKPFEVCLAEFDAHLTDENAV